jgi:hypothetical protein
MTRKPPEGYPTWIALYDYLQAEKPELLHSKSIVFYVYNPKQPTPHPFKLSIRTLKAYCWQEIQEHRLTYGETHKITYDYFIQTPDSELVNDKLIPLLSKLAKWKKN